MNHAFSAKRQASKYSGIPCCLHTALTCADVLHRDRLAAAGVVGDGQHHQRNALAAHACDQLLQRRHVHVALERMQRRGLARLRRSTGRRLRRRRIPRWRAWCRSACCWEPRRPSCTDHRTGCARRRAPGAWESRAGSRRCSERIRETARSSAARVALVAPHHRRPLLGGHGAGAGVGQQVDQHVIGGQKEQVVVRRFAAAASRSARVVQRIGSTLLMRNGSMIVLAGMAASHLAGSLVAGAGFFAVSAFTMKSAISLFASTASGSLESYQNA